MRQFALAVALLALAGCSFLAGPPALPDLPAGAEPLAGDGAWEVPYDNAYLAWHDEFRDRRPFDSNDYWLTEAIAPDAVLAAYDKAFEGWSRKDRAESRGRWISRTYERNGQLVAVAIFLKARHGGPYDILRVLSAPARS